LDDATAERTLAHIREIALQVRTTWFTLLFVLTFAGITLLGVEDADFFVYEDRQTLLPLLDVTIPIETFYAFSPLLILTFYVYLHIQLIHLWNFLDPNHLPSSLNGVQLGRAVYPGLVTDFALRIRADGSAEYHPLAITSIVIVFLLIWAYAPLILFLFWWKSLPLGASLPLYLVFVLIFLLLYGHASFSRLINLSTQLRSQKIFRYASIIFIGGLFFFVVFCFYIGSNTQTESFR